VLCELGSGANCPFRRTASGEWFWKRGTILNARLASHPASGNGNASGQSGDATSQYCNASGWNCDASGRHPANYSWIHIAERNSENNGAGFDNADQPNPGQYYAAVNRQPKHPE
jgi:hypothetical protein